MHRNGPFIFLLALIILVTGWFGVRATMALVGYARLNTSAPATVESLELRQKRRDQYQIFATYTFESRFGQESGEGPWGPIYKNPWSAEKALARTQGKTLEVWFNDKKPRHCTLIKTFPMKITLSTTILIGLALYFLGLGIYVGGQNGSRT